MTYHISFDLGDQDVVKPYNGIYDINIIIADSLLNKNV